MDTVKDAHISRCGQYRYLLTRQWNDPDRGLTDTQRYAMHFGSTPKQLVFVMLNPSTADAYEDDPTIRRCIGFGQRDGFDMIHVANLYAGRATNPDDLFKMDDPEGSENERIWGTLKKSSATIICAWGADKRAQTQAKKFLAFMGDRELHCLGKTKHGQPKHPLYLKGDTSMEAFSAVS